MSEQVGEKSVDSGQKTSEQVGEKSVDSGQKTSEQVGEKSVDSGQKTSEQVGEKSVDSGQPQSEQVEEKSVNSDNTTTESITVVPRKIGLPLYEDELNYYRGGIQKFDTGESTVLRHIRKKSKKLKFKPLQFYSSETETSSYESDASSSGGLTDVSSDSGIYSTKEESTLKLTTVMREDSENDDSNANEGDLYSDTSQSEEENLTNSEKKSDDKENERPTSNENFYEKSKKPERETHLHVHNLIKYGLDIKPEFAKNISNKIKKKKKDYYVDLIQDKMQLIDWCKNDPDKYKRGVLQIEASHNAKCVISEQNEADFIEISGRSKCGKAFTDDDVVVEILASETDTKRPIRMNKDQRQGRVFGKVIGLLNRHRCANMDYPVFVCEIDEHEMDKAKPVCKTVPKFLLVRESSEAKRFSVDVYKYLKKDRILEYDRTLNVNKHLIKSYLFYVVCLSWEKYQYPVGAVFAVHRSTRNFESSMAVLDLLYKVPSLYGDEVITLVEKTPRVLNQAGRFDLTSLEVFTIDPEKATVFDDAISLRYNAEGYEVGVHITDVASVVKQGTALDKEAWQRGTSYFPGQFLNPRHMLPEPISEDICCLLPEENRLSLTVFLYFNSKKQFMFEKTKFCKGVIKSRGKFSYKEAQEYIDNKDIDKPFAREIRTLYDISRSSRKKRLGDAAFAVPSEINLPGEGDADCFDAYYLIEEFMIYTNHVIAILLMKHFPNCVPLRCQNSPDSEKVQKWINKYSHITDIVLKLQGKNPLPQKCLSISNIGQNVRNDIIPLQNKVWKSFEESIRKHDFKSARCILFSDEMHPFQALALKDWENFQETAVYKCSGNITTDDDRQHFSLGLCVYVHFTAPIRRYIDIVCQRLFHAVIDKTKPYDNDQISNICSYFNGVSKNAQNYRCRSQELVLATLLANKPFRTQAFVKDFSEEEVHLLVPCMNFVQAQVKSIQLNSLNLASSPETKPDMDYKYMPYEKECLVLKWKKRIYSVTEKPPRARNTVIGYQKSKDEYQKLHPHQKANFHKLASWVNYLRILLSGATASQLKYKFEGKSLTDISDRSRYLQSQFNTELDINSELNKVECSEKDTKVMFTKQVCKYSVSFHHGQILYVQFSSDMKNGFLMPTLDFLELTSNVKHCLKHMRDPVSCFESYSTKKATDVYKTSQDYKDTWSPIVLMEASYSAIREAGVIINDVYVKFQKKRGFFTLKSDFCFERCIDIGLITCTFLESSILQRSSNDLSYSSDYVCIRCPIPYDSDEQIKQKLNCSTYFWLGHAKISKVHKIDKNGPNERIRIHFQLVNDDIVPEKISKDDTGIKCSIEILQRLESEKRMEVALNFLNRSTELAKSIALNKRPPELDIRIKESIKKTDIDIGLSPNNLMQTRAIKKALGSSFSLIHGPPGTGKTNTGIKLIHLFYEQNKRHEDEDGSLIVFCGPSNKSVDVVARRFMKFSTKNGPSIVRFYGTSIEQHLLDIPGNVISYKKGIDYKPESDMNDISAHTLIRSSGESASIILQLEADFRKRPGNVTQSKMKEYKEVIKEATQKELSKHNVIFATTSMATSPRLLKAVGNKVFQLIIDECGMCTEPECVASIVALKPKQVVLIGDHQQLRPVVMCKQAADLGLERSLFERYSRTDNFVQLNMQYRMHESICKFPSEQFYNGNLKTANTDAYDENPRLSIWLNEHGLHRYERHIFCHVEGDESYSQVSTDVENERSCSNKLEVEQVVKIFKYLYYTDKIFNAGRKPCTLNIMSQYNAQCTEIKEALARERLQHSDIHTVVSSQGGEWDYVIFSLVRSLPHYRIEPHPTEGWCKENLGFITDHNQINVALTRAKKGLFIIGNKQLLRCDKRWRALLEVYEKEGCVLDGAEFPRRIVKKVQTKSSKQHKQS